MSRLLIISCSQRKRPEPGLLPAIERYDGPAFRVLRRYLRSAPSDPPAVYILSAEFGLIPATRPIPVYDRRMTRERGRDLRPVVTGTIRGILGAQPGDATAPDAIAIFLGKDYLDVLDGFGSISLPTASVTVATGGPGARLSQLHDWLYGGMAVLLAPRSGGDLSSEGRIRGMRINLTAQEVLGIARVALAGGLGDHSCHHSWSVVVDGQHVAPKWLVSQITGLGLGSFTTQEAVRLLHRIGVTAERNRLVAIEQGDIQ